ncbi:Hypothetical protein RY67_1743 [Bifidobacterium longum subsp. infantis]|uniref:Uncharacterized protein n=1 Tax=Bifidobacterium longum subsp. infantis TaxID=1682 RepID=A0A0M3T6K0_BIFLI|nr:Hypothetical protein RY67_1743 [Bifidobacterium longum subsp. infantis]
MTLPGYPVFSIVGRFVNDAPNIGWGVSGVSYGDESNL